MYVIVKMGFVENYLYIIVFKIKTMIVRIVQVLVWVKWSVTSKLLEVRTICFTILKNRIVYEKHILRKVNNQ